MIDILSTIIKYLAIDFSAVYIFALAKRSERITKRQIIGFSALALVTVGICLLKDQLDPFHIPLLLFLFIPIISLSFKTKLSSSVPVSIISFGFSYVIFTISVFITAPLLFFIFLKINISDQLIHFAISVFQIILTFLLFKSKRIKNGFGNIIADDSSIIALVCSALVILTYFIINTFDDIKYIYLVFLALMIICFFILILWRRDQLNKSYIKRALGKQNELLESALLKKDTVIDSLRRDNDSLASVIHRDNKLLPAMAMAVREQSSDELAESIEDMLGERNEALKNYESQGKGIEKTGFVSIDALLLYITGRAEKIEGEFSYSFTREDFSSLIPDVIGERELVTILADLLENSVIASADCEKKHIRLETGNMSVSVSDSGKEFEPSVFENMGYKKITTRAKTGGSGIGLMSVFEFARACKASIIIEEYEPDSQFSKKITVSFDRKSEFKIISHRAEKLRRILTRPDVMIKLLDDM
ncbi:MAG: sensor histidine kinase [Clostridia bacterium]|nr:sensor histidine kinase [Clostridia bacterium]